MRIGLIAGGFKPFTSGHYFLVKKASEENDLVHLFVSTKDRVRKDQHPITWNQMKKVWKILKPALPRNVEVHFSDNPTTDQFSILEDAEKSIDQHDDIYSIYADAEDIRRYDNPRITEKTLRRLYDEYQLLFKPFERSTGVNVSGTGVRQALQDNDLEAFVSMMPGPVQPKGHHIFKLLGGNL
jgi:cytidyltransferase-like protein